MCVWMCKPEPPLVRAEEDTDRKTSDVPPPDLAAAAATGPPPPLVRAEEDTDRKTSDVPPPDLAAAATGPPPRQGRARLRCHTRGQGDRAAATGPPPRADLGAF